MIMSAHRCQVQCADAATPLLQDGKLLNKLQNGFRVNKSYDSSMLEGLRAFINILACPYQGFFFLYLSGYLFLAIWAWAKMCAPDIFSWNFSFTFINSVQLFFILYRLRPLRFHGELEEIYNKLFEPMKITRYR